MVNPDDYSIHDDYRAVSKFLATSYVINLESAPETLQGAAEEFNRFGLSFARFPAVWGEDYLKQVKKSPAEHPLYAHWQKEKINTAALVGVKQSHLGVVQLAKMLDLPHVCIFEDDISFSDDFLFVMARVIESLPEDWEALHLGGTMYRVTKQHINQWISVPKGPGGCQAGHAYIVRKPLYNALLDVWTPWEALPLDTVWDPLQKTRKWYLSRYWVGFQRYTYSYLRDYNRRTPISRKWWVFDDV